MKNAKFEIGISTLASGILFYSCLNFGKPKTVTREPMTPEESRIEYQVPAPAKLNLSLERMAANAASINQFGFYFSSSQLEFQAAE